VTKAKGTGVKAKTIRGISFRPVFLVADHRTTGVGQLDPDLVPATGFQGEFDQGALGRLLQNAVMGDGMAGSVG
jgi:hypothetical protein